MKNIKSRLSELEQYYPQTEPINTILLEFLKNAGYDVRARINIDTLDYSSQSAFDGSVLRFLTDDELEELLKICKDMELRGGK